MVFHSTMLCWLYVCNEGAYVHFLYTKFHIS